MRVAAFIHFSIPKRNAGSEVMIHRMLVELVEHGHDVRCFVTDNPDPDPSTVTVVDGVEVQEMSAEDAQDVITAWRPDILVAHHMRAMKSPLLAHVLGVPWVLLVHNDHPTWSRLMQQGRPELTVFNTRWIERKLARGDRRSMVVHPPVDAARHATTPGDRVTLVNPTVAKGSETFYALAERLPATRFLVVEGAYGKQDLRTLPNVEIVRHTSRMRDDVWSRTSVLLIPSEIETYGMVGVEALASGIPVLAHPTTGLVESLSYAGLFVDRDDIDAWKMTLDALNDGLYSTASSLSLHRSRELDPTGELKDWVKAIESLSY